MKFDVDLGQQSTTDDLPDKTQNQMFPSLCNIRGSDVDDGTPDGLGGGNDDVIVLRHLEVVQRFAGGRQIEDTSVDSIWNGVVD